MDPQTTAAADSSTATVEPATQPAEAPITAPAAGEVRQAPAAPAADGAATAATPPTPDYRRQYEGLQGVYNAEKTQAQQRIQAAENARQAAEQRAQQAELARAQSEMRLQGLSPEQIRDNVGLIQAQQAVARDRAALTAEKQRNAEQMTAFRQAMDGPARQIVAAQIAKEYGVPAERIAHLSHPDLMRELATEIRGLTRQDNLSQRKASGTDKAESGGGGGQDWRKLTPHDQLKLGLKQHHAASTRR